MRWLPLGDRTPSRVTDENLELVMATLAAHDVPAFVVRTDSTTRRCLGVYAEHRARAVRALATIPAAEGAYARWSGRRGGASPALPCADLAVGGADVQARVVRVCRPYATGRRELKLGFDRACEVEFWERDPARESVRIAPRRNVASDVLAESELAMAEVEIGGRTYPTPEVFLRRMVDDIDFPIDVVCPWVDGDDPEWRAKRRRWQPTDSAASGSTDASLSDRRFRSRDELKYFLRSVQMYAPWVRHVYLVTDDQVPEWLDPEADGLTVVSHSDLFRGAALPTFSSRVISSYVHRIEGLAEHFLYFNDDVFLGQPLEPGAFFTPAGQARVFRGLARIPFGDVSDRWTVQENTAINVRRLLERTHGVSISRGSKHTPRPLLRSELATLEERHQEEYARTRANRFRHHSDIDPVLLFDHHALVVGVGVDSAIDYEYVNLGDDRQAPKLDRLLRRRHRQVFCLNDTVVGDQPIADDRLRRFLERYFPIPSTFERPGLATR